MPELEGQPFLKYLDDVYTTGVPFLANEALCKLFRNGEMEDVYFNFVYQPFRDVDNSIIGVTCIAYECTNEAVAKQKIEVSEKRLRQLADSLPPLVWETDPKGNQIYASKRWKEFTGLDPQDTDSFEKIVHPDDLPGIIKVWTDCLASGTTYRYEVRLKSKEGNYHWFQVHGEPICNDKNEIEKWIGAFTDITDRVKAEEEIKINERQLQDLFKHAPAAVALVQGPEHRYILANKGYQVMASRTSEQLLGKTVKEAFPEIESQGIIEAFDKIYKTGKPFQLLNLLQC